MRPDLLTQRVNAEASEPCVIVSVYFEDNLSLEQGFIVRDALNALDTDGWWFFNPGSFIAAFRCSRSGRKRARACESALERLAQDDSRLPTFRVGSAEGPVLTSFAVEGHLETPPLGNAVNEAFWKASKNAS